MNEFLKYLLDKLVEDINIVQELLTIDNKIGFTNLSAEEINMFLTKNLVQKKLLNLTLNNNTLVLTEGNPFTIIRLINDFPEKITKIYLSNSFIAINRWLYAKYKNYYLDLGIDIKIELGFEKTYIDYYNFSDDILVIGSKEFIKMAEEDFDKELIKVEIN